MTTPATKLAIVINWTQLRDKMKEYLDWRGGDSERALRGTALSDFLIWLRDQQRPRRRRTK